jgi:hypothetical protein
MFTESLPSNWNGADHIENTSCSTFSIVACAYFGRCLDMGIHDTIRLCIYHIFLNTKQSSMLVRDVTLRPCIWEVPGSNLEETLTVQPDVFVDFIILFEQVP